MGWDEVCVLCGIRPVGGPTWFCPSPDQVASKIAKEICDSGQVDLTVTEVRTTIFNAISKNFDPFTGDPRGSVEPGYDEDCIAIGYFDNFGSYVPCTHHGRQLHPTGDGVQVRRVNLPSSGARFTASVQMVNGERRELLAETN